MVPAGSCRQPESRCCRAAPFLHTAFRACWSVRLVALSEWHVASRGLGELSLGGVNKTPIRTLLCAGEHCKRQPEAPMCISHKHLHTLGVLAAQTEASSCTAAAGWEQRPCHPLATSPQGASRGHMLVNRREPGSPSMVKLTDGRHDFKHKQLLAGPAEQQNGPAGGREMYSPKLGGQAPAEQQNGPAGGRDMYSPKLGGQAGDASVSSSRAADKP